VFVMFVLCSVSVNCSENLLCVCCVFCSKNLKNDICVLCKYVMDIDIWQCRGHLTLSAGQTKILDYIYIYIICYNLFTAGGVLLQGELS